MVRLFTTTFPVTNWVRSAEFREALRRNVDLDVIEEVHLLVEGDADPGVESPKIFSWPVNGRPVFDEFFSLARELTGKDDISVIANSDIYFDRSLGAAAEFLRRGECYCLSRWERGGNAKFRPADRQDSQDVWIFRGPIRGNVVADFPIGVPRCDNRLLYELQTAGYMVRNP